MHYLDTKLPSKTKSKKSWGQLYGCSKSLAISNAIKEHQGLVVVVTEDSSSSHQLHTELRFIHANMENFLSFPEWETLPYDVFSPHEDIVSERVATLQKLPKIKQGVIVLPISTCMQRVPPKEFVASFSVSLEVGQNIQPEKLKRTLVSAGYNPVSQVMTRGEFTSRASIIDFFPMGSSLPYRVEFFDDEIDTIRTFDIEKQVSLEKMQRIEILPAREIPTNEDAIKAFRQRYRAKLAGDPNKSLIYQEVSNGHFPAGIEYYQPLFFDQTIRLFDYFPENTLFVMVDEIAQVAEEFEQELFSRYEQRRHDIERPVLPPEELYLSAADTLDEFKQALCIQVHGHKIDEHPKPNTNFPISTLPAIQIDTRQEDPARLLKDFLEQRVDKAVFIAESLGRREFLNETLRNFGIKPTVDSDWFSFSESPESTHLLVAPFEESIYLQNERIAIICESALFGNKARQRTRKRRTRDADAVVQNLSELTPGAPIVHEEHGVGRYIGLQSLDIDGDGTEFLTIEYYGGDKLYVPVANLHLVSRYTGSGAENAPWHKLGNEQWSRARQKAAERARDVAAELLDVYARREAKKGIFFDTNLLEYNTFASSFAYEETPDQQSAIDDVLSDMGSSKPMDRVVCGDVGFGKTEVAMRAVFIAASNGKQAAVLAPTTLLTQQHYQSFCDRFAEWPFRIEALSRFNSAKKQKEILADLKAGKVDIVIGTHKLFSADIEWKDLGLIVVDEEQRFGVRHKEKLKALRAEVDMLTLTATPIPRTLNMSLSGLRDLSIIATPPSHRHAIKTFVSEWNDAAITEACVRELKRGGQIYFLHNEVKTIDKIAKQLETLIPHAKVRAAHGQLAERELEEVMLDFYHARFNILICTTIVESGIDVSTANTIIINRADKLGLSQLHQLRGRVGRSHHRAYAYLLAPPRKLMTPDAVKRLDAIESLEELGVGFTLATHDLEIRGAGELLGEEQSGQIQEVGYTMYNELLARAVQALRSGQLPETDRPLDHGSEVELGEAALLPNTYVPDVHMRLVLYKRIASASSVEQLKDLQIELIDRFGLLPDAAKNLFASTELKLYCAGLGIVKIAAHQDGGRIVFDKEPKIDVTALLSLLQKEPSVFKLVGNEKLYFTLELDTVDKRIDYVLQLINNIAIREAA